MKTRKQIFAEMTRIRDEIQQIFNDADHWNNSVRKPDEAIINPDPDGFLRKNLDSMTAAIIKENREPAS